MATPEDVADSGPLDGRQTAEHQVREGHTAAWFDSIIRDLRYSARSLAANPAFTITAALSVALGVGANVGIFTLVNALLLQPLPVRDAATLTVVYATDQKQGGLSPISHQNYIDLRERSQSYAGLAAAAGPVPLALVRGALAVPVFMEFATANYFDVLGLQPALGRFFAPEEDVTPGTHPVIVLSHGTWQRRLGGDPSIIGQTVRLNGIPHTVIGVAPAGFKGLSTFFGPELWVPSVMAEPLLDGQGRSWLRERETAAFTVFGRLRQGVTRPEAEAELRTVGVALERDYPAINRGQTVAIRPVAEIAVFPGLRTGVLAGSALLLAVVGLVLVIACSNVANLLLARAAARRQEIAVRLAIGASRARLVRQLLTESLLLGLLGGSLGLACAALAKELLWAQRPAVIAESLVEPQIDGAVLAFTVAASLVAGLLFGLVPALQASRPNVAGTLQDAAPAAGGRTRRRWSDGLVAAQVALSLICLVVAGLFLRAVQSLYTTDPGFETRRLAILNVSPRDAGYPLEQAQQYYRDVRFRLAGLPGVERVAWASNPLLFGGASRGIEIPGGPPSADAERVSTSQVNTVDADYFTTVGIALRRGRAFTAADRRGGAPVAIVNEAFAARYWPGEEALGRRFRFSGEPADREVVGVARTAALTFLGEPPQPCVYLPLEQAPQASMVLYLRTVAEPEPLLGTAQRVLRELDAEVPVQTPTTIRELMDNNLWIARLIVALFAALGVLGLALASVGLYGVLSYAVRSRRREIGVRLALGAERGRVVRLVLMQGLKVVALGAGVGLSLSWLSAVALSTVLGDVRITDPLSFGGATLILVTVATLACYLPARRASRLDPAIVLRQM